MLLLMIELIFFFKIKTNVMDKLLNKLNSIFLCDWNVYE